MNLIWSYFQNYSKKNYDFLPNIILKIPEYFRAKPGILAMSCVRGDFSVICGLK